MNDSDVKAFQDLAARARKASGVSERGELMAELTTVQKVNAANPELKKKLAEAVKAAKEALEKAEALADLTGLSFDFDMGGSESYSPVGSEDGSYYSSGEVLLEGQWVNSSTYC